MAFEVCEFYMGGRRLACRVTALLLAAALVCVAVPTRAEPPSPAPHAPAKSEPFVWQLDDVLPDWMHLALAHRIRYEYLDESFRKGRPGSGSILSLRTTLHGELRPDIWRVGAELVDSRVYLHNDVTAPDNGIVNTLDVLQAYGGVSAPLGRFHLDAKAGRMTIDIGSRRLVARNQFRNTINNFTGLDVRLAHRAWGSARVFAVLPVERSPRSTEPVASGGPLRTDRERFERVFVGQIVETAPLALGLSIQGYAFELFEQDGERATRNRRLVTPGFRVLRPPSRGALDFELEGAMQVGTSRAATRADDTTDLSHLALFQHASVGYTFDAAFLPRILAQYDYASGDRSPLDRSNNRFDSLFGARRFEYGPAGAYGALARSNLRSPGLRVQVQPHPSLEGLAGWRAAWLAEARDAWVPSGLSDPTGASGNFIGHQIEGRIGYAPFRGNLRLEVGAAHLFPGGFVENAPDANPNSATTFVYTQLTGAI